MISEPTADQIARAVDVARQVEEWRAKQTDLMEGMPCGKMTRRQCLRRQAVYVHEIQMRSNSNYSQSVHPRFILCVGCKMFRRIPNPKLTNGRSFEFVAKSVRPRTWKNRGTGDVGQSGGRS